MLKQIVDVMKNVSTLQLHFCEVKMGNFQVMAGHGRSWQVISAAHYIFRISQLSLFAFLLNS